MSEQDPTLERLEEIVDHYVAGDKRVAACSRDLRQLLADVAIEWEHRGRTATLTEIQAEQLIRHHFGVR